MKAQKYTLTFLAILLLASGVGLAQVVRRGDRTEDKSPLQNHLLDKQVKEDLTVTPDGTKEVFHDQYDGYRPFDQPATTFTVVDLKTSQVLSRIPYYHSFGSNTGRFIDSIKWVGDRYVVVSGDRQISILDTLTGMQSNDLLGDLPAVSPNGKLLAFREIEAPFYGGDHPDSTRVGLAMIEWTEKTEGTRGVAASVTIYPTKEKANLSASADATVSIETGPLWSSEGELAFIDHEKTQYNAIVIKLDKSKPVPIEIKSFAIASEQELGKSGLGLTWEDPSEVTIRAEQNPDFATRKVNLVRSTISVER